MVNIGTLPPAQKRHALNIAPEYCGLTISKYTDSPEQPREDDEAAAGKDQQTLLLSKIANLRKAINEVVRTIKKAVRTINEEGRTINEAARTVD